MPHFDQLHGLAVGRPYRPTSVTLVQPYTGVVHGIECLHCDHRFPLTTSPQDPCPVCGYRRLAKARPICSDCAYYQHEKGTDAYICILHLHTSCYTRTACCMLKPKTP